MPLTVDGTTVAEFLGQGDDPTIVDLAGQHVLVVQAMASAYTRGRGFDVQGFPYDDVAAVITTATARLLANPEQIPADVGGVSIKGGFVGWSLAELFVLNRYRARAQ
ncbi:MAG: hypothetical protein ACR2KG_00880 [Nocardioidaceae bacterium]